MKISEEVQELFDVMKSKLGGGVRKIEIDSKTCCNLLKIAIQNYNEQVLNFIIENNWSNFYGKQISNTDLTMGLTLRTLDVTKSYSYLFSKEVGLQQRGPWELKKDFFEIKQGQQCYVVPAGREINKVMFVTPPTVDPAMYAYGGLGAGFGGGVMGQVGMGSIAAFNGGNGYGYGTWCFPLADISYYAADLKHRQQMFSDVLMYKVTAGPDGTHLIHLIDGGKHFPTMNWSKRMVGCYCWYTYYDMTGKEDECSDLYKSNPDVYMSPDQVDLKNVDYELLNDPAKAIVRRLFIAECAETIGLIRGVFSGNINMISSPLTMDYNMFLNLGKEERQGALDALKERLQRMSPYEMAKREAELVENTIKARKGVPLGLYVR